MKNGRLVIFLLIALVWLFVGSFLMDSQADPDVSYPMANQRITWLHEKNP